MNGLGVRVDNIVKVGQLVKLLVKDGDELAERNTAESFDNNEAPTYGTRIEDLLADSLVVSWPTDQGVPVRASAGQNVSLEIKCQHGILYLESRITDLRTSPVPVLQISKGGDWSRSQLRKNVRLAVTVMPRETILLPVKAEDLGYKEDDGSGDDAGIDLQALRKIEARLQAEDGQFRSVIRDLSAGGMLLASAICLEKGSLIRIVFPLGKGQPDISVVALVVRSVEAESESREYPYKAGCKFIGMTGRDEDNTIKFIFARQAELRRSGML